MQIGVPKETVEGERRAALVPEVVKRLAGEGHTVAVQRAAGAGALISDALYEASGVELADAGAGLEAELMGAQAL
jgi:NAD(P) transhydrogenase subunit alpha